jgi:hypothetical protein
MIMGAISLVGSTKRTRRRKEKMFDKFYYCTNLKLKENSVIEKGSNPLDKEIGVPFGFEKLSYKWVGIELILEIVRLEEFPEKPRRSEGIFVCKDFESFCNFVASYRSNTGVYYYEVAPVKDNYKYHIGDYTYHGLTERMKGEDWHLLKYKDFLNHSYLYWGKKPEEGKAEVLLQSPIKIVKEIDIYNI